MHTIEEIIADAQSAVAASLRAGVRRRQTPPDDRDAGEIRRLLRGRDRAVLGRAGRLRPPPSRRPPSPRRRLKRPRRAPPAEATAEAAPADAPAEAPAAAETPAEIPPEATAEPASAA